MLRCCNAGGVLRGLRHDGCRLLGLLRVGLQRHLSLLLLPLLRGNLELLKLLWGQLLKLLQLLWGQRGPCSSGCRRRSGRLHQTKHCSLLLLKLLWVQLLKLRLLLLLLQLRLLLLLLLLLHLLLLLLLLQLLLLMLLRRLLRRLLLNVFLQLLLLRLEVCLLWLTVCLGKLLWTASADRPSSRRVVLHVVAAHCTLHLQPPAPVLEREELRRRVAYQLVDSSAVVKDDEAEATVIVPRRSDARLGFRSTVWVELLQPSLLHRRNLAEESEKVVLAHLLGNATDKHLSDL